MKVKMKICLITPEYITENTKDGGLARYIHNISIHLSRAGHTVTILTRAENKYINKSIAKNLKLVGILADKKIARILNILTMYKLVGTVDSLITAFSIYKEYKRLIAKRGKFDAVHAASYHFPGLFLGPNKVIRLSSYEPLWASANKEKPNLDSKFMFILEDFDIRFSRFVYAPSKLLANYVSKRFSRKIDIIRPPLPERYWENNDKSLYNSKLKNKKYILYFGSLTHIKGIYTVLDNIDYLLKNTKFTYVFIGKGEIKDKYLSHPRIIKLSSINRNKLEPIIAHSSAVLIPSHVDNLPNSCIEAMSCGKIVVGYKGTSVDELVINNECGFILSERNIVKLTKIFNKIYSMKPVVKNKMEIKAKKRIASLLSANNTILKLANYLVKAKI